MIYYVIKYTMKSKIAFHMKLMIITIMHQVFNNLDVKKILLQIYNKIEKSREVRVSEILFHILQYPDHYIDVIYSNLHMTYLLNYIKCISKRHIIIIDDISNLEIIIDLNDILSIISSFDDYIQHELFLNNYYLYNYYNLIYKQKDSREIFFNSKHSQ